MRMRRSGRVATWLGGALVALPLIAGDARAVEFLRADANSDGEVTISDAFFTTSYLFRGSQAPECGDAADTNGDGTVNISDVVGVLNYVVTGQSAPAAPFPEPGEGTGPGVTHPPCASYGNGEPLVDPAAELSISQVDVEGGASRNATIVLAVSSSDAIGGFYTEIVDEAGVIDSVNQESQPVSGPGEDPFFLGTRFEGGVITVGFMTSLLAQSVLPAGEDLDVVRVDVCLKAGTEAGEYPLTLRAGELIAGGAAPGRAISPALGTGTIVVDAAVPADAECTVQAQPEPPRVDPPDQPPPAGPPPLPPGVELVGEIRLGSATARPGEEVELPFIVRSNGAIQGFSFSLDFDEEVLQATAVEESFIDPASPAVPFWVSAINNSNETPGNNGVDEGYVIGAAVPDLLGLYNYLPADTDNTPVVLSFAVNPNATAGSTTLSFVDGGKADPTTPGTHNILTAYRMAVEPTDIDGAVLIDGILNILPDVSAFFLRGDANGDRELNITDPRFTLNYLFQGGSPPPCMDAADANDDGRLNVTDPITTLHVLFGGQSALPAPFDEPGVDPTDDDLGCSKGIE